MMHFSIRILCRLYIILVKYTCWMAAGKENTHFPASMWVCSCPSYENFLNMHILQGCGITDAVIIGVGRLQLKCDGTRGCVGGKWRGNWRMEWVVSTLHTTSEHGVSSITTADAHTSAASSRLNWRPPANLNGLVCFAGRRNLVSARVPSHFSWPVLWIWCQKILSNLQWWFCIGSHTHGIWELGAEENILVWDKTRKWTKLCNEES